ncbi:coiled-coil domain-containing protein 114-like [Mastacembelus armatus]|uniref:coiled-coil domain-containing protein 114-like n=1 Tax=Mastacembelus armatus TaxID=205130 RepID=UPI000E459D3A|nr:coiled-coil domain-containing protein 114-like [Mastacembelus armatus]
MFNADETDLNKLQLQYRRLEAAKQEIQRLQEEHEKLLRNLSVTRTCCNPWTDANILQDLTAMLTCGDTVDEELKSEKAKIVSLKDQGQRCFSELMTRNEQLREELKALQTEKKQFLHLRSQLEKELHAVRKDVCYWTKKCTDAFNDSVKVHEKQRMLLDQNDKDSAHYIKERSSLELGIKHYCNFEAFLYIKATAHNKDSDHIKEKPKQECMERGLKDFEDAIKKVLRETEESDLDKLVTNLIQLEGQNYSLLKFVNHQHNEAETIRKQISQLSNEMEIFAVEQKQEEHEALQLRTSTMEDAAQQQLAAYQQRAGIMEKILEQLMEGIKSLLQIGYDNPMICDRLGFSDRGQNENMTEYLTMTEDRVNELLTLQSCLYFQENTSQWDLESLSSIAGQLLGIVNPITAAATPAPHYDLDSLESVFLEAKDPISTEDVLTLVKTRIQRKKNRLI